MKLSGHRILVADDDPSIQFFMSEFLKKEGLSFDIAGDGAKAVELLKNNDYSLVVLDEKMPNMNGINVLRTMRSLGMNMPAIMITAYGSKELAMRAISEGAYDFFTKPIDIGIVRTVIKRAIERYELQRELDTLKAEPYQAPIIAESPSMKRALMLARKVAETDVTTLIRGESGSGKELIAKTIHRLSKRRSAQFVSVNCAAIPEGLLESELFGYEKGAFTGASHQHTGKFERAEGGTIFLDEIADLSLSLQAKLLRVLQDKKIERLGGKSLIKVDIRVISATNRDISLAVREGLFREDLLYRIKVFEITVPPLRERKEDIPLLTAHLLKRYSHEISKNITGVSKPAMRLIMSYYWPGNVREMENILQRAIIVEDKDNIQAETLREIIEESMPEDSLEGAKEKIKIAKEEEERKIIVNALLKTKWRREETADILGISRKSLFLKMKKYGL